MQPLSTLVFTALFRFNSFVSDLSDSLSAFVTYVQTHLTGDEKGESADFLDHLFRALGHDGIKEAGASRETRVAKKGGGKTFADLLWPERVLIEMKSRGKKLDRAYDQVFDYWTHIVPHRPPFVILCNFDEFWIYDFNQQLFDPVEKITLTDLPSRAEALAFLLPTPPGSEKHFPRFRDALTFVFIGSERHTITCYQKDAREWSAQIPSDRIIRVKAVLITL